MINQIKTFLVSIITLLVTLTLNAEAGFYNQDGLKLVDNNGKSGVNNDITVTSYNTKDTNIINATNVDQRWERSWKVNNTSSSKQNIDIIFVYSNAGYSSNIASNSNQNNYVVLDSTSKNTTSFKSYVNGASNVINNNKIRFNKVKLKKNETIRITLGTKDANKAPLPVELIKFDANYYQKFNKTILKWSTASETNNSHFIIERTFDGKNYRQIGKVIGEGTTTIRTDYLYTDVYDSLSNIENIDHIYYRLKQVDYDGSYEYSNVIKVDFNKTNNQNVLVDTVQLNGYYKIYIRRGRGNTEKIIYLNK